MIVEYIDSNSIYEDKHTDETYGCYTILGWNGDRDKYGKKNYMLEYVIIVENTL